MRSAGARARQLTARARAGGPGAGGGGPPLQPAKTARIAGRAPRLGGKCGLLMALLHWRPVVLTDRPYAAAPEGHVGRAPISQRNSSRPDRDPLVSPPWRRSRPNVTHDTPPGRAGPAGPSAEPDRVRPNRSITDRMIRRKSPTMRQAATAPEARRTKGRPRTQDRRTGRRRMGLSGDEGLIYRHVVPWAAGPVACRRGPFPDRASGRGAGQNPPYPRRPVSHGNTALQARQGNSRFNN
jgi:hypothetical protein